MARWALNRVSYPMHLFSTSTCSANEFVIVDEDSEWAVDCMTPWVLAELTKGTSLVRTPAEAFAWMSLFHCFQVVV